MVQPVEILSPSEQRYRTFREHVDGLRQNKETVSLKGMRQAEYCVAMKTLNHGVVANSLGQISVLDIKEIDEENRLRLRVDQQNLDNLLDKKGRELDFFF